MRIHEVSAQDLDRGGCGLVRVEAGRLRKVGSLGRHVVEYSADKTDLLLCNERI